MFVARCLFPIMAGVWAAATAGASPPGEPASGAGPADTIAAAAPAPADTAAADTLRFRLDAVATIAASTPGPGQVVQPAGVATDAFGRVYVTDAALHKLQRYDARGVWLGESGTLGSGAGQMRRPGAVAALGTLGIAVLDQENRRVLSYDLFGRLVGTLIDLQSSDLDAALGRVDPVDMAADRGGAVAIADRDRDRLLMFDFSGRYVRSLGGFGARPGSFRGLSGVAVDRRGNLVTTERVNARVQRLDSGGRVLAWWPLPASAAPGAMPVAVDDSARVAVADEAAGRLWLFDSAGRLQASLEGLKRPSALAFARDGTLLLAEAGAGRVRRFVLVPHTRDAAAGRD